MKAHRPTDRLAILLFGLLIVVPNLKAGDPNPPLPVPTITVSNGQESVNWTPYPGAKELKMFTTTNLAYPLSEDLSGLMNPNGWTAPMLGPVGFRQMRMTLMPSNEVFTGNVLNRLTFGPTPEDVEHIRAVGPQAFINEQMAFEGITESLDTDPPIVNTPLPPVLPPPLTNWIRVSFTTTSTDTNFFFYLAAAGRVYIDDVRLVLGTVADTGTNLLLNGDFEDPQLSPPWFVSAATTNSVITNSPTVDGLAASGTNCLLLVSTATSLSTANRVLQPYATNKYAAAQKFTFSFSYLPVAQARTNSLYTRMSGGTDFIIPLPNVPAQPPTPPTPPNPISPVYAELTNTVGSLEDIRAWTVLHEVQSKRQLYEIMVQFFENHFSTQYQKTKDWFDNNFANAITNDTVRQYLSVDMEFREHMKWRQLLLDPNCTFYDLLKVSVDSPAMIIYLDTILSTRSAANENYGREIMELHTMGADNGYIQQDIVDLAKVWTGWSVAKKDMSVANDPFATPVLDVTNSPGVWVLHFKTNSHNYNVKRIFTNNVIDARFGSAFRGGQSYSLIITNNQFPGTNGMQEGYRFIQHVSDLPYTAEFISVKLCRVFVHENFDFGVYDYRLANLSPEAQLVRDCMTAWFTAASDGRHGNIRSVLNVIFNSDLFRGYGTSQQKVKTPLEFAVSAVRAIRLTGTDANGWISTTGDTDGYGISGLNGNTSPLGRMGSMGLFNKTEPDGYSEFARVWLNTANLCERMRFAQHLLMAPSSGTKSSDYGSAGLKNISNPLTILKAKLPSSDLTNATVVVNYFLGNFYPGEGDANLNPDRRAAIQFLDTDEYGAPSNFSALSPTSAVYDGRVRGMVALLMCFPRFQEQ
ncbi:MAG TPA: DUF1800 family protein [Candidatus Saccharimonadales bacterium]|nr:DUF1800 family protein [Candidatus Saccharimonadales bacterium]